MSTQSTTEIEQVIETLQWLAYYKAWTAGFIAGGGDPNAALPQLADVDYQRDKAEWAANLP